MNSNSTQTILFRRHFCVSCAVMIVRNGPRLLRYLLNIIGFLGCILISKLMSRLFVFCNIYILLTAVKSIRCIQRNRSIRDLVYKNVPKTYSFDAAVFDDKSLRRKVVSNLSVRVTSFHLFYNQKHLHCTSYPLQGQQETWYLAKLG